MFMLFYIIFKVLYIKAVSWIRNNYHSRKSIYGPRSKKIQYKMNKNILDDKSLKVIKLNLFKVINKIIEFEKVV